MQWQHTFGGRVLMAILAIVLAAVFSLACAPTLIRRATAIPHFHAQYVPTPGDDMAAPLLALTGRLEQWGLTITDMPADQVTGFGIAYLRERRILLNPALTINGRFEVLAHEAGHFFQPANLQDLAVAQVFAESVGVGVQRYYRSKTALDVGARYLAGWKDGFAAEKYLRAEIDYAIRALTGQTPLPQWRDQQ